MRFYFLPFCLFCLFSCETDQPAATNPLADSLTHELNSFRKGGSFNGFAVSIVTEKGTLYQQGFGYDKKGVKTFFGIWDALEKYQDRLKKK